MQGSHLWVRITLTFGSFNGIFACLGHAKSLQSHKACWMCPSWCRCSLDKAQPADLLCSFEVMHYSQLRLKSQWIRCVLMIQLPFLPLLYPVWRLLFFHSCRQRTKPYKSLHLTHLRKCFETWHKKIASDLLVLTLGDSGAKRRVRSWRLKFHAKQ